MRITVKCFAGCKDAVGQATLTVDLPAGSAIEAAFDHLAGLYPDLNRYRSSLRMAVNTEYAPRETILRDGDTLALIPPVSGGMDNGMYRITTDPIKPDALHAWVIKPHHGAVVTFAGTVRDNTGGRRTARLEYEAYAEMAEKKMREIGEEIREKWGVEEVAMLHRVGRLEIGDISILIAVATPHRKKAFEACAYAIDRVKEVVPIWKKEVWEEGAAQWVERNEH